jgi:putative hydrolase of the HAD superfamily
LLHDAKAITFDVGGTLDGPGIPWRPRLVALYRAAGVDASENELARAFFDADDRLHARHELAGLDLAKTVRLQVEDTLSNLGIRDRSVASQVAGAFVLEARASFAAARPVLQLLRHIMPLGIVSNFYGNLRDVLRWEGLLDIFATVIDSRAAGFEKPDPRIFLAATSELGLSPGEVVHVGDSIARDVAGARGAGLVPIWYAPEGVAGESSDPALRIRSLGELAELATQRLSVRRSTSSSQSPANDA